MTPEQKLTLARIALSAEGTLFHFMGQMQRAILAMTLRGEEWEWAADTILELAERIRNMPQTYQTDGQGREAVAHLHYFGGYYDFYISEKDRLTDHPDDMCQHQAFGLADMGYPELGYISIQELIENNIELDLYWTPRPLKDCYK